MSAKGRITISRPSYSDGRRLITISITDKISGIEFVEVEMDVGTFGEAVTGLGGCECEFETRSLNRVGMKFEHKEEIVPVPGGDYTKSIERAQEALKPFEVDGWKGRVSDATNSHRRVGGSDRFRVVFTRHVHPETGEPVL